MSWAAPPLDSWRSDDWLAQRGEHDGELVQVRRCSPGTTLHCVVRKLRWSKAAASVTGGNDLKGHLYNESPTEKATALQMTVAPEVELMIGSWRTANALTELGLSAVGAR